MSSTSLFVIAIKKAMLKITLRDKKRLTIWTIKQTKIKDIIEVTKMKISRTHSKKRVTDGAKAS